MSVVNVSQQLWAYLMFSVFGFFFNLRGFLKGNKNRKTEFQKTCLKNKDFPVKLYSDRLVFNTFRNR